MNIFNCETWEEVPGSPEGGWESGLDLCKLPEGAVVAAFFCPRAYGPSIVECVCSTKSKMRAIARKKGWVVRFFVA